MVHNDSRGEGSELSDRLWRFADCEFDELRLELRVHAKPVELELKPLEVLLQLLRHAGEVVTKEELLDAVWPGLMVVDGSLATAMSKLRKALGQDFPRALSPRQEEFEVFNAAEYLKPGNNCLGDKLLWLQID